jgi:hypothetical protein
MSIKKPLININYLRLRLVLDLFLDLLFLDFLFLDLFLRLVPPPPRKTPGTTMDAARAPFCGQLCPCECNTCLHFETSSSEDEGGGGKSGVVARKQKRRNVNLRRRNLRDVNHVNLKRDGEEDN